MKKYRKKIREIEKLEKITNRELNESEKAKIDSKKELEELLEKLTLENSDNK